MAKKGALHSEDPVIVQRKSGRKQEGKTTTTKLSPPPKNAATEIGFIWGADSKREP